MLVVLLATPLRGEANIYERQSPFSSWEVLVYQSSEYKDYLIREKQPIYYWGGSTLLMSKPRSFLIREKNRSFTYERMRSYYYKRSWTPLDIRILDGHLDRDTTTDLMVPLEGGRILLLLSQGGRNPEIIDHQSLGLAAQIKRDQMHLFDVNGDGRQELVLKRGGGLNDLYSVHKDGRWQRARPMAVQEEEKAAYKDLCGYAIEHPERSPGLKFSRACQYAFVIPTLEMSLESQGHERPEECTQWDELRNQVKQLSSDASMFDNAAYMGQVLKEMEHLAKQPSIQQAYTLKVSRQHATSDYKELNPDLSIEWRPLEIESFELGVGDEPLLSLEADSNTWTIYQALSLEEACHEDYKPGLNLLANYSSLASRAVNARLTMHADIRGKFKNIGLSSLATLIWDINVDHAIDLEYSFSVEDEDDAFGLLERRAVKEAALRALVAKSESYPTEDLVDSSVSPEYYFNGCFWESSAPCIGSYWQTEALNANSEGLTLAYAPRDGRQRIFEYQLLDVYPKKQSLVGLHLKPRSKLNDSDEQGEKAGDEDDLISSNPHSGGGEGLVKEDFRTHRRLRRIGFSELEHLDSLKINTSMKSAPSLRRDCGSIDQNPDSDDVIYFDSDCQTAYITPPNHGTLVIHDTVSHLNMDLCGDFRQLQLRKHQWQLSRMDQIQNLDTEESFKEWQDLSSVVESEIHTLERTYHQLRGREINFHIVQDFESHLEHYRSRNPWFQWHVVPLSGQEVHLGIKDHLESIAIDYDMQFGSQRYHMLNVQAHLGLPMSCALGEDREALTALLMPRIDHHYAVSGEVDYQASLNVKRLFDHLWWKFDLDFFFISIRANLSRSKDDVFDVFQFSLEDSSLSLEQDDINRLRIEVGRSMLTELGQSYDRLFRKVFQSKIDFSSREPKIPDQLIREVTEQLICRGDHVAGGFSAVFDSFAEEMDCLPLHLLYGLKATSDIGGTIRDFEIQTEFQIKRSETRTLSLPRVYRASDFEMVE
ncbi:hypothetical protein [Pseudobacteriovorax antillogorgiicola]|nr:hypothetical protein [Pseudobacteriovorax antillogorgiicola]